MHAAGAGASWGMFWGFLFGILFFVPLFGMAAGDGVSTLMDRIANSGIEKQFHDQVRRMLRPGTSALFMMVEQMVTGRAVGAVSKFGGTVLRSSLSVAAERELRDALHGSRVTAS